jgi:hypothetical protein
MKNIFYIVSLLVIAGAAWFSYDVNKKFQEEYTWIHENYTEKEGPNAGQPLGKSLLKINADLAASIEDTRKELKSEQDQLAAAKKTVADREAEIEVAKANERTLQRSISEKEATLEDQQVKLDELNKARVEIEKILGEEGVTLEELPNKIQEIRQRKKDLTDQFAKLEEDVDRAEKSLAKNQDELARLRKRKAERAARIARNTMEAVITGVNNDWGFVIVGAGSKDGFTPQTTVLVKRGGRVIARLKPTSIEPHQTIFEIDYDSMAPGVRLSPGDRVLLSKPRT